MSFKEDYECEFVVTPRQRALEVMVERYFQECDAYDSTVCTGPEIDKIKFPRDRRERGLINRNAIAKKESLKRDALAKGYTPLELGEALKLVSRRADNNGRYS